MHLSCNKQQEGAEGAAPPPFAKPGRRSERVLASYVSDLAMILTYTDKNPLLHSYSQPVSQAPSQYVSSLSILLPAIPLLFLLITFLFLYSRLSIFLSFLLSACVLSISALLIFICFFLCSLPSFVSSMSSLPRTTRAQFADFRLLPVPTAVSYKISSAHSFLCPVFSV